MTFNISNSELEALNGTEKVDFPKYTSQLVNWANQNAQGTRPRVVGQLSELFPQFQRETSEVSIESWKEWYTAHYPDAIEEATDKIYAQVLNLKEAIQLVDRELVADWVEDLVISKTYNGLYFQQAILAALAKRLSKEWRLADPYEEARGIDGYVGDVPYSVKPDTYKTMGRLSESIDVKMIYYTKTKTSLKIEVDE